MKRRCHGRLRLSEHCQQVVKRQWISFSALLWAGEAKADDQEDFEPDFYRLIHTAYIMLMQQCYIGFLSVSCARPSDVDKHGTLFLRNG